MRAVFVTLAVPLALTVATPALAAPLDEEIQILRARPTGMDEAEWRKQRREVARKLGESSSPKAVDALIEVVQTERYDSILTIAIQGLANQGDTRALPALQRVYADRSLDTFVREDAGKAIVALGGTPRDDARLTGEIDTAGEATSDGLVSGPQLGTMGAASAPDEALPPPRKQRPLPENLRGRDRAVSLGFGALDLRINSYDPNFPVAADADVGARVRYVDDRSNWGWSSEVSLSASVANGDYVAGPGVDSGEDAGDSLWIREALAGNIESHVYIKESDWHGFIGLGLSQRLNVLSVDGDGAQDNVAEGDFSQSRFGLDVVPHLGIGYGRYLNSGGSLLVDAIVDALQTENILARPIDPAGRRAIQEAVFAYANDFASYPRMAAAMQVLRDRGYLARSPSPRLIYRLIRVVDDPSYVERMQGPRVRVGFLFDLPVAQGDYLGRQVDKGVGGPFLQLDYGIQLDIEREIQIDTRVFYDSLFDVTGYTTDSGVTYSRNFHGDYHDYLGTWHLGLRGGISKRTDDTLPNDAPEERPGYRAMVLAGYSYAFNRGSAIDVGATAGIESRAFIVGVGLGFRFGIAHASIVANASTRASKKASKGKGAADGDASAGGDVKAPSPATESKGASAGVSGGAAAGASKPGG